MVSEFRPCIDIHKGKVKQIIGSSLEKDLVTNFESEKRAEEYAELYKKDGLFGGHVILLGRDIETKEAGLSALKKFPNGLQIGGGVNLDNAKEYIEAGARQVIVTSFVFTDGKLDLQKLRALSNLVGKQKLVLDLSCRKKQENSGYFVVQNRWKDFTDLALTPQAVKSLENYCAEFLVHGVEVEGKRCGVLGDLITFLAETCSIPVTYAGGVRNLEDMQTVHQLSKGRVNVSVGSALDIFGGDLKYEEAVSWSKKQLE
eukprot:augustus_masked-scaffold_7-processed-gene-14.40-mRNA-1 protein AED:0.02 eAED:0.02 QI:0/-1/0/1/-1/1/1/0/257